MPRSNSTSSKPDAKHLRASRGFAFSIDSAVAVVIVVSAVFLMADLYNYSGISYSQSSAVIDDALFSLERTGYMIQTIDTNSPTQSANLIRTQLISFLSEGFDANVSVIAYDLNSLTCAAGQTFASCFDDENKGVSGSAATGDYVSGKKYFLRRQPPGDCNIGFLGFSEASGNELWWPAAQFPQPRGSALLADDANVTFDVTVDPSDAVTCDQNVSITLGVTVPENFRKPIDLMMVLDRSGSMAWDGQYTTTSPNDIFASGNYLYMADGSSDLRILDISDPASPASAGLYTASSTTSYGVHVSGNYAYLAQGTSGLRVVNVLNPASPSLTGLISTIGDARKVFVSGNYAYVATITNGSTNMPDFAISTGTQNVNLSVGQNSSTNWAEQSFTPSSNTIRSASVYIRTTTSQDPPNNLTLNVRQQTQQGTVVATGSISRSAVPTSYTWIDVNFGSDVQLDPSETYYLELTTTGTNSTRYYQWGATNTNPYASGSAYLETAVQSNTDAYMRTSHRARTGLNVIDISTPSSPVHKSSATGTDPNNVYVSGNYAYFTDGSTGLKVVDISNPLNANTSGLIDTTDAQGIAMSGNYAYVADGSSGLRIINVQNPASPSISFTHATTGTSSATDVALYDNNVYLAEDTNLNVINVSSLSTPSSPATVHTYGPYYNSTYKNYDFIEINNGWAFLSQGYNGLVTYDVYTGPKLDQMKVASSYFVNAADWNVTDQIGLVSFNNTASNPIDQTLLKVTDTNKIALVNELGTLFSDGGTGIGEGINAGTTELNSVRHNTKALKFMVVLTDGVNNGVADPITAAQNAASNEIVIFTVGFGGDADTATLQQIATIGDGNYYFASDQNSLQTVFELIAKKVGELANDSNVSVPVLSGASVEDLGGGTIVDGNIIFNAGSITKDTPWSATYTLNFPCNSISVCGISALTFPGPGTKFSYTDSDGNFHSVDFNKTTNPITFKTRDLKVDITSGEVVGSEDVVVDILVQNMRELDANSTTLRLYLNDTVGSPIATYSVPALCSAQTPLCTSVSQTFSQIGISHEGPIYATINDDNSMRECPANNVDAVNCYGGPQTQMYVVDYTVWRK